MSEHGVVTEAGAVRFERLLPASVDRVWDYLTRPELRAKWFAGGGIELRPGGAVTLHFRNSDLSAEREETPERFRKYEDVTMRGEVIRAEPPRLLVHNWVETDGEPSEVTFELEPRGEQTLLTLIHRKLSSRDLMLGVSGGWHTHLAILEDVLAGRPARPFWSTHARVEKEYEALIPED